MYPPPRLFFCRMTMYQASLGGVLDSIDVEGDLAEVAAGSAAAHELWQRHQLSVACPAQHAYAQVHRPLQLPCAMRCGVKLVVMTVDECRGKMERCQVLARPTGAPHTLYHSLCPSVLRTPFSAFGFLYAGGCVATAASERAAGRIRWSAARGPAERLQRQ
jgi:hypothetical protein